VILGILQKGWPPVLAAGPVTVPGLSMPLSEADQDAFVAKLVGSETAEKGAVDYVSTRPPMRLLTRVGEQGSSLRRPRDTLRLVMVSDTHERHRLLDMPPGDVLVHSGDILLFNSSYSRETTMRKLRDFDDWVAALPYREKVVVAGNHDYGLQELGREGVRAALPSCTYLENEYCQLESGLRIFGSPASIPNLLPAWRGGGVSNSPNRAFQYTSQPGDGYAGTEADLAAVFDNAPGGLDLLLVHGPIESMEPVREYVLRERPPLVVCGHVHEQHGVQLVGDTLVVNATSMGPTFSPTEAPLVLDLAVPANASRPAAARL